MPRRWHPEDRPPRRFSLGVTIFLLSPIERLMELQGKVAVVTGASSGIGASIVRALARSGCRVVLAARSELELAKVAASCAEECETLVVPTDVRDEAQIRHLIEATVAKFGQLDILVNNAGFGVFKSSSSSLPPSSIRSCPSICVEHFWRPGTRCHICTR